MGQGSARPAPTQVHRMKSFPITAGRRLALLPLLAVATPAVPAPHPAPSLQPVATPAARLPEAELAARLAEVAPAASPEVLKLAARAMSCALRDPALGVDPQRLGVIDYSRPSTEPR